MSAVRQPILKPEIEEKLKMELEGLWATKMKAKDIAETLGFGKVGTDYEKLQVYHIYFYRIKFDLPARRYRQKGISRYKHKQEEIMTWQEFVETLDAKTNKLTYNHRRQRSYLILHYWTPLRKSEIYERTIDDFEIKKEVLEIHLLRKKKIYPKSITDEPLSVPLAFPKMEEVVEWLEKREWVNPKLNPENRPWNITYWTAWSYVREIFPGYYPHFFRFNWITDAANDPETTLGELKVKTGLHISTLNKYIMSSRRLQEEIDKRRLKRITK